MLHRRGAPLLQPEAHGAVRVDELVLVDHRGEDGFPFGPSPLLYVDTSPFHPWTALRVGTYSRYNLFHALLEELRATVTRSLMHIRVQAQEQQAQQPQQRPAPAQMPQQAPSPALQPPQMPPIHETHLDPDSGINEMDPDDTTLPPGPELHQAEDDWSNTPRNSACPCGSGKKYKHCHGALSPQQA